MDDVVKGGRGGCKTCGFGILSCQWSRIDGLNTGISDEVISPDIKNLVFPSFYPGIFFSSFMHFGRISQFLTLF